MKRLLLLFLFISLAEFSHAQLTHHFPHSNAVWSHFEGVYVNDPFGDDSYNGMSFYYAAGGDTLISGTSYIKIYVSDSAGINLYDPPRLIREEQEQVYYFDPFTQNDLLLYDFSLQPGETANVYTDFPFSALPIVDSIGMILTGNEERKCIYFNQPSAISVFNQLMFGSELEPLAWIEGIGSTDGPFAPYGGEAVIDGISFLSCFKENDTLKFGDECNLVFTSTNDKKVESTLTVFPNPTSGLINITSQNSAEEEVTIFSLQGKEVFRKELNTVPGTREIIDLSEFQNGIYLISIRLQGAVYYQKIEVLK